MIQNKAPCKQKKRPPESHAEEVIVVSSTKDKSDKSKTAVNRSESPHDTPGKNNKPACHILFTQLPYYSIITV